jgi:ribose/xylose/arabinose/galactoside ABC-type transport system permease subunit
LQDGGPRVVFPITAAAIGTSHPQFFSFASIETILRQPAPVGSLARGMARPPAMVEIGPSVGGIGVLAGTLAASPIKFSHVEPWPAGVGRWRRRRPRGCRS